jgi:hypothetical protein
MTGRHFPALGPSKNWTLGIDPEAIHRSPMHLVPPLDFRPIVIFLNSIRQIPLV